MRMSLGYFDPLDGSDFSTDVINSIFTVASILLFISIVLAINSLRRRFSAITCLELGVLVFLFVVTTDVQIRLFLYQNLLAPIIEALLASLRRLFEIIVTC
jgi:hypothetical protein